MKYYLITDTHFNHKNMVQYCQRPENFDDLLWQSLESLPDDCVLIHLGDVCFGSDDKVHERLKKLPYKKILIRGNHDKKSDKYYLENGWNCVCDSLSGHYYGKYITFSHEPIPNIHNLNIHGHIHNHLPRLLAGNWAVEGEEERNREMLRGLNSNHKLLAVEFTGYKAISLEKFISEKSTRGLLAAHSRAEQFSVQQFSAGFCIKNWHNLPI